VLCKTRREQCSQGGAAISGACDPHGKPLVLLGKPAGAERERNAEARAGNAEQHAHCQNIAESVDEKEAVNEREHDGSHLDDGGVLAADVLREHAEWEAHERARQRGNGDHHSDLRGGEMKLLGDERTHRAVQDPDGEREVEVEKRAE
jgi:hypothetical protein